VISGVLLDLSGVVHVGDQVLPGAIEAIERLHDARLPIAYITNTTRRPKRAVIERCAGMGLKIAPEDLITPAEAAKLWLKANRRSPHLLIHPSLKEDFEGLSEHPDTALVVGDAADGFTYEALNSAFRALTSGAAFLALARNRAFMDTDHALSLDAGAFVAALEYASQKEAILMGKPAPDFYSAAVSRLGVAASATVMVGDDAEADVSGALSAGIGHALLVRTGKYLSGAERSFSPAPTAVLDDLPAAVDWILGNRS
jgi:HAD superfamily hydrolase (TIGR01458 family)